MIHQKIKIDRSIKIERSIKIRQSIKIRRSIEAQQMCPTPYQSHLVKQVLYLAFPIFDMWFVFLDFPIHFGINDSIQVSIEILSKWS
jgi:hypothetical protein